MKLIKNLKKVNDFSGENKSKDVFNFTIWDLQVLSQPLTSASRPVWWIGQCSSETTWKKDSKDRLRGHMFQHYHNIVQVWWHHKSVNHTTQPTHHQLGLGSDTSHRPPSYKALSDVCVWVLLAAAVMRLKLIWGDFWSNPFKFARTHQEEEPFWHSLVGWVCREVTSCHSPHSLEQ